MAAPRRRWVPIVFGIAVLLVFVGIGAIIAVTAWFQQNLQVETRSLRDAESEFDTVRKKFGDRRPLLEMRDGRPEYSRDRVKEGPNAAGATHPSSLQTLYVLVWDPDDERLARFSLPFWLLRMKSDPIRGLHLRDGRPRGSPAGGHREVRPGDHSGYGDRFRRARPSLGAVKKGLSSFPQVRAGKGDCPLFLYVARGLHFAYRQPAGVSP